MSEHTGTRIHPCYVLEDLLTLFTSLKSNFTLDTLGGRVSRVNIYAIPTHGLFNQGVEEPLDFGGQKKGSIYYCYVHITCSLLL